MNSHPDYDVSMEEVHHTQKLDAPSGTAITAAGDILARLDRKSGWENGPSASAEDKLLIRTIRKEKIPGTHTVTFRSEIDSIELQHTAIGREGSANRAVAAAAPVEGR